MALARFVVPEVKGRPGFRCLRWALTMLSRCPLPSAPRRDFQRRKDLFLSPAAGSWESSLVAAQRFSVAHQNRSPRPGLLPGILPPTN